MEHLVLDTRASLPDLNDKSKLQLMEGSVFYKLLKMKKRRMNKLITRLIMETYNIDKKAFFIGNKWCILCEAEVAFLLGLKPNGKDAEEKPAVSTVPQFFIDLASQVALNTTNTNHLMKKGTLQEILVNTVLNEENRDSFRKLIYFYLLNFFLFPNSDFSGRLMYFSYDIHDMEETNWAKVILEFVINDICEFKNSPIVKGKKTKFLKFFAPLLEAWFYYRTNSIEHQILDNPDDAPLSFCKIKSTMASSKSHFSCLTPKQVKSKCSQCKGKEESLSKEAATTSAAGGLKLSLSYEPEITDVHQAREPDVDQGLDSDSRNKNDGEVQSDLKDTISKDGEEHEEMVTEFGSYGQVEDGVESVSDSNDQEDEKMQRDSNSWENTEEEMHTKANIEGDGSLQDDTVTSLHPIVESNRRALHSRTSRIGVVEQETSGKNITPSIHKVSVSSTTERHKSDSPTTKFEGYDIRSDLVQTLQKIWQKHGNIIKDRTVSSRDIVARALESLATMVRILEDNPARSLSDDQADYLSSTLSDLEYIHFNVCWLVPFVEKALLVHKSKPLVESLNNLNQLNSEVEERKAILLDEIAKLYEKQNKLKEEIAKVSKMIPFSGQVNLDEPIGVGFT
ncbi:uncharacterized protein LOC141610881 [Silene latifolia]|uniref:uncharacterized protein LOC141610881 n=1 Tax=Silene latifolia TaxID=37657 RepID=UPI003D7866A4